MPPPWKKPGWATPNSRVRARYYERKAEDAARLERLRPARSRFAVFMRRLFVTVRAWF